MIFIFIRIDVSFGSYVHCFTKILFILSYFSDADVCSISLHTISMKF